MTNETKVEVEDIVRFGKKTGYFANVGDHIMARRVCVENAGERGVSIMFEKLAGEAQISTSLTISHAAANALCVLLGKVMTE